MANSQGASKPEVEFHDTQDATPEDLISKRSYQCVIHRSVRFLTSSAITPRSADRSRKTVIGDIEYAEYVVL
jgi:hypothetical protein